MPQRIVQVDAFTATPFGGNAAAVCVLDGPREPAWMQKVAAEMNLSETAFLHRDGDAFALRWFTPTIEVALCGHATLASAHVLWEDGHLPRDVPARFQTKSGPLGACRRDGLIELDMPAKPVEPAPTPAGLTEALGVAPRFVGKSQFDYLALVDSEADVRAARPDFGRLRALPVRGLILTAPASTPGYDFVSRFFAPNAGVDEDPVTGSAHCSLAPFWRDRLGKAEMVGYQASVRGGVVRVRPEGGRVYLGGQAVTVLRGELLA